MPGARVTLHEGRYHQVRRMFAATGNHVSELSRSRIGALGVGELAEGEWKLLSEPEKSEPEKVADFESI